MRICSVEGCGMAHLARGWCERHYHRWLKYGDPLEADRTRKGGKIYIDQRGYLRRTINHKTCLEHRRIIEKALGKELPIGSVPHHVDENPGNNKNNNLVLCDSQAYHFILHRRAKALKECGHASWRKCRICKKYDNPLNLVIYSNGRRGSTAARHPQCHRDFNNKYSRIKREKKKRLGNAV